MENIEQYDIAAANALCEARGCKLINYEVAKAAFVALPSNDNVIISVGATTAKVFQKNPFFAILPGKYSWLYPKAILTFDMQVLDAEWQQLIPMTRLLIHVYILYAMLDLITSCKSSTEIRFKYATCISTVFPGILEKLIQSNFGNTN
jgi:hypothetical protein